MIVRCLSVENLLVGNFLSRETFETHDYKKGSLSSTQMAYQSCSQWQTATATAAKGYKQYCIRKPRITTCGAF